MAPSSEFKEALMAQRKKKAQAAADPNTQQPDAPNPEEKRDMGDPEGGEALGDGAPEGPDEGDELGEDEDLDAGAEPEAEGPDEGEEETDHMTEDIDEADAQRMVRKGQLQRFHCKTDTYWNTNRYRPGDIQDFKGDPPKDFPIQHFERE